jgi:methanogenic corrinoid protein MtbC1
MGGNVEIQADTLVMASDVMGGDLYGAQARAPSIQPEIFLGSELHERQMRLAEVIAGEIVPRLKLIHHHLNRAPALEAPGLAEIVEFGALAIGPDEAAARFYFEKMRAKGHSLETLFVDFLAPTARYLGELWDQDRCDFIDVTLGVARLQNLLSLFGSASDIPVHDIRRRALLISTPAERHLFGVEMVAKFMRAAGWDVLVEKGLDPSQCVASVATEWIGVVGVTLSAETGVDEVARIVEKIRRASMNRAVSVMVGGPAFAENPSLIGQAGADAAAADAPTAVILAKKLLLMQAASA